MTTILNTIEKDLNGFGILKRETQVLHQFWRNQDDADLYEHKVAELEKKLQFYEGSLAVLERLAYLHAHELRDLAA